MFSGGVGQIDHRHLEKNPPQVRACGCVCVRVCVGGLHSWLCKKVKA